MDQSDRLWVAARQIVPSRRTWLSYSLTDPLTTDTLRTGVIGRILEAVVCKRAIYALEADAEGHIWLVRYG